MHSEMALHSHENGCHQKDDRVSGGRGEAGARARCGGNAEQRGHRPAAWRFQHGASPRDQPFHPQGHARED